MFTQNVLGSMIPILVGAAFTAVLEEPPDGSRLTQIALVVLVVVLLRGLIDLGASFANETLAQRFTRDARDEIYVSLLGKSQTFHNRQRVGDLMARTANDVRQLGMMVNPGMALIIDSFTALIVPIVTIALLDPKLLPPPLIFTVLFFISLRHYMRKLTPASMAMRSSFGQLNSGLAEAVTGVEVVKSMAQEEQEDAKFDANAGAYRDAFVEQGMVQARYLPPLILALTIASALLLGIYYHSEGQLTIGELVTYIGLVSLLRFPTFISIFTFSLVQIGLVSSKRILDILNDETDLDSKAQGHSAKIEGDIRFENVTFSLWRRAGAEERLLPRQARRDGRHCGRNRIGQEHTDQADQPHLRCRFGPGAGRWRRRAATGISIRSDRKSRPSSRTSCSSRARWWKTLASALGRMSSWQRSKPPPAMPRRTRSSASYPMATKRSSASGASPSPVASGNASLSPAR